MRVLDLFCGAGGASMGYHQAGFEVVGVDINPQPHYPFRFHQIDVMNLSLLQIHWGMFDLIHASPPCQAFTRAQKIQKRTHPDLVAPVRELLVGSGLPYIIENVEGAPLVDPIMLCGAMFGLGTYRHRLFETSFSLSQPPEPLHDKPTTKMGRTPKPGEMMHVVGHFSGIEQARTAMGIDWMTRDEIKESIPPAYTRHIAEQFLALRAAA